MTNKEIVLQARASLKGKWGIAIAATIIICVIQMCLAMFGFGWDVITGAFTVESLYHFSPVSSLINLLIGGAFALGIAIFSLTFARQEEEPKLEQVFYGFKQFFRAFLTYLLMNIFIFLWTLLLIIPGIIAMLAYSLTFFIIAEDDNIGAFEAIRKSREMMNGYKWKLFCLFLRFFLLSILCIFTLGIGYLWLIPYIQVSCAQFYLDVKNNYNPEETEITPAE